MGYRNYIASLPRKEYNIIKHLDKDQLYEYKGKSKDDYIGVYHVAYNRLHELGKYVGKFPKRLFKPVFKNRELQCNFSNEHDFYLVGKKFLEAVINRHHEKITSYYNKMLLPFFGEKSGWLYGDPSEFLNSVKTEYGYGANGNKRSFDFSKITAKEQTELFNIIHHVRNIMALMGLIFSNINL